MRGNVVSVFGSLWHDVGGDTAKFFPASASSLSHNVDKLADYLFGVSLLFSVGIFAALIIFCWLYRRRPGNELARAVETHTSLEITWMAIPLAITLIAFAWGGRQYIELATPPEKAESVYVMGKQWMWKTEHLNGVSEINQLHVPIGRDVQLIMVSEDVIHSFFIPDFRTKWDVLPGRYTRAWFHAEKTGEYHFLCTQYCGTDHSEMVGTVYVMTEDDYNKWLVDMKSAMPVAESDEVKGARLFAEHGCVSCHASGPQDGKDPHTIGPNLDNVFGSYVRMSDQSLVRADENYMRESILNPHAKVVAGYQDVMPSFAGQLKEDEVFSLIRYLRGRGLALSTSKGPTSKGPISKGPTSKGVSLNDSVER